MKKKYQFILSFLLLSVSLVACGNEEKPTNETAVDVEETEEIKEEVSKENVPEQGNKTEKTEDETTKNEEKIRFVTNSINDLFNFDNTTYDERNEKIQENFTVERVNEITSMETLDSAIDFVSTVDLTEIYQDIANEDQFAIEGEMSFQVDDNEATIFRNILTLTIEERDGQYLISEMEMVPIQNQSMIP